MSRVLLPQSVIDTRLRDKNIEIVGEYLGSRVPTQFRCLNGGHEWITSPTNIFSNKSLCPYCSGNKLTKSMVNDFLSKHKPHIEMIGDYLGDGVKTQFKCSSGHLWLATPQNVKTRSGCPSCAPYGFNVSKPAHVYVLEFDTFVKFGITNSLESRLLRHKRRNGEFNLKATKLFENGRGALDWETKIKQTFQCNYVTRDVCPDGFTETIDKQLLTLLLSTL